MLCGFCFSPQLLCPAALAAAAEAVPAGRAGQRSLSVNSYFVLSIQTDLPSRGTEPSQEYCKTCAGGLGQLVAAEKKNAGCTSLRRAQHHQKPHPLRWKFLVFSEVPRSPVAGSLSHPHCYPSVSSQVGACCLTVAPALWRHAPQLGRQAIGQITSSAMLVLFVCLLLEFNRIHVPNSAPNTRR